MTETIDEIVDRIKASLILPRDKRIILFEELYNPLHFYCRLQDCGIKKEDASSWANLYEQNIYNPIIYEIRKDGRQK